MTDSHDETVAMPGPDDRPADPTGAAGAPAEGPPDMEPWWRTPGGMIGIGVIVVLALVLGGLLLTRGDDGGDPETTSATGDGTENGAAGGSDAGSSAASADEAEIREWQEALNTVGCDAGAVDGVLGTATFDALAHFQNARGLPSDGAFTDESIDALLAAAAAGETVCTPDNAPSSGGSSGGSPSGQSSEGLADAIFEVARGRYVTEASGCPTEGGLPDIDPTSVTTDVSNLDALESDAEVVVLQGVSTAPSFGAQPWTYDADNDVWTWLDDFCAGYTGG